MKISSFSKFVGAGVIAASLAVLPFTLPGQAQNDATTTNTQQNGETVKYNPNHTNGDNDLGWIGLLGLAGLAGLLPKKRQETVYHTESNPNVGVRSDSDYQR